MSRVRPLFGRAALVLALSGGGALAVLAIATPSRAEGPSVRHVEVAITGDAAESATLLDTVRELLGRQQLTVVRPGENVPVLARARIVLPAVGRAEVEVVGHGGRVLLRREVSLEGARGIGREAIAHLVQEAVEAELLGVEVPPKPERPVAAVFDAGADAAPAATTAPPVVAAPPDAGAPPPARPPAVARAPEAPSRGSPLVLDVGMLGGVGLVANGSGPVPRVGASAMVAHGSRFRPGLGLLVAYAFPFERSTDVVAARTSLLSARVLPTAEVARSEHVAFDVSLGGGIDVVTVQPRSDTLPAAAVGASSSRVGPIVTGAVTARVDLVPSVVFVATAGVDVDPVKRAYVVARGPETTVVTSPWAVRPTLLLGFAFTALGPPTFAAPPAPGVTLGAR